MPPGTFALAFQDGDASGFTKTPHAPAGSGGDFSYTQKFALDLSTDTVWGSAGEHEGLTHTYKYVIPSNAWTLFDTVSSTLIGGHNDGHSYDSNVIVAADRMLYVSGRLQYFRKMNLDSGVWAQMADPGLYPTEPSMEYFPDKDELLLLQAGYFGAVKKYNRGPNSWTAVFSGSGSYNAASTNSINALQIQGAILRYNPIGRCMYMLGGIDTNASPNIRSQALLKYDSDGSLTRLADIPASVWLYIQLAIAFVDPVTGDLIIINAVMNGTTYTSRAGSFEMWKYSLASNAWSSMDFAAIVPAPSGWFFATDIVDALEVVPLPQYGVTMIIGDGGNGSIPGGTSQSKAYLYKHAVSTSKLALVLR